jgi:trans-L-3-hydroxyproline dehydratase
VVEPDDPTADLAVLFTHNEGYRYARASGGRGYAVPYCGRARSTMCGHATLAVARWAVDSGRFPADRPRTAQAEVALRLQCPCGTVAAYVAAHGAARFVSVPSFAVALEVPIQLADGRRSAPTTRALLTRSTVP